MIRDLARILGPQHRRLLATFLVSATIYGVLQGLSVVFLVPIARELYAGDYASAGRWLGVMAIPVALCCVAHYIQALKGYEVALILLRTMHQRVGDHLVTLPLGWFDKDTVGRVSQLASKGTLSVGGAAAHLLTPLVIGIATPATIVVSMLAFDLRLGLVLALCSPLIFLAARYSAKLLADADEHAHHAAVESGNRVLEFARCQPVLRAFGRTTERYPPLDDAIEQQRRTERKNMWAAVTGLVLTGFSIQIAFTALIVVGALLALGGDLDPIQLVALLGVTARFAQPLGEVGELGGAIRMARADIRRMSEVLATAPIPEPATSVPVAAPGRVELERVGFGYRDGSPVLRDVSFTVPPRTMTALVGSSGSGKTTVTRLIARFYDVDAGTVRVGGVDVRDQTTADLMAQLALVFQDVYLFDDTLWANIAFGRAGATDAEIREAARLAGVDEIVGRLPMGWDTVVGEGGSALSGGERQRVSIARAVLKRAPIVLLDEATAALDPENETYIQQSMQALMGTSTLLVIAHKLTTVVAADQIVVLGADGTVAEIGTHTELFEQGGRYRDFWNERNRARGWSIRG